MSHSHVALVSWLCSKFFLEIQNQFKELSIFQKFSMKEASVVQVETANLFKVEGTTLSIVLID